MQISWIRSTGGLLLTAATVFLSGCVGGKNKSGAPAKPGVTAVVPSHPEVRYRVRSDTTPFYHYGPQQPDGPDLSMKKGTDVLMVKRAFGYSQVKTVDTQQTGYIATEDVSPLTQPELAAFAAVSAPPPLPGTSGTGKKSRAVSSGYTLPPPAPGEQENLPMPGTTSTPPPNNMFRY